MIRTVVFALSFLMNLRFKQVNDVPSVVTLGHRIANAATPGNKVHKMYFVTTVLLNYVPLILRATTLCKSLSH